MRGAMVSQRAPAALEWLGRWLFDLAMPHSDTRGWGASDYSIYFGILAAFSLILVLAFTGFVSKLKSPRHLKIAGAVSVFLFGMLSRPVGPELGLGGLLAFWVLVAVGSVPIVAIILSAQEISASRRQLVAIGFGIGVVAENLPHTWPHLVGRLVFFLYATLCYVVFRRNGARHARTAT